MQEEEGEGEGEEGEGGGGLSIVRLGALFFDCTLNFLDIFITSLGDTLKGFGTRSLHTHTHTHTHTQFTHDC